MTDRYEVLDPTYDERTERLVPAPRLADLQGATIGIISNGKHGTGAFFDALADELAGHHRVARVERLVKADYSAPAGDDIMDRARAWNALVAGIGD